MLSFSILFSYGYIASILIENKWLSVYLFFILPPSQPPYIFNTYKNFSLRPFGIMRQMIIVPGTVCQQPLKKLPENIVHFLSLIAFIFTLMRYFLLARTSRITLTHSFITLFFGPPSQHSSQTIKGNKDRNSDRLQLFSLIAIELLSILLNAINFCKYLYNFKYSKY